MAAVKKYMVGDISGRGNPAFRSLTLFGGCETTHYEVGVAAVLKRQSLIAAAYLRRVRYEFSNSSDSLEGTFHLSPTSISNQS